MDSDDSTPHRQDPERERIPLERKISLKFKEFRGFITEYSANISEGGMFITTDAPQPPGAVFDFEFRLADDDFQIIHGIGEVVWVRDEPAGADEPPGMGIRFLHLAEGSRDLIRRMVDEHEQSGGTPFDLESQAPDAPAVAGPDELADTATLDVPSDEEPDSMQPEEGYGLPPAGAPGRGDEPLLSPVAETPDGAPTDDSESAPGEQAGDASGLPYQRFDAAMASLRERRARDAGEEDLPPGFGEVQAALGDREVDAEEEVGAPPVAAGRFPDTSETGAKPISDPDFVPPDLPPAEPRRESLRRDAAAGRSRSGARWFVLILLGIAALAAAGHFLLPGGLPGIPGDRQGTADAAPDAPVEEPGRADPLAPPADETEPVSETLDAEIVEEPQTAPAPEPTIAAGETTDRAGDEAGEEAAAMPAPAAAPSGEPFTRVENVAWHVEGGRTVVELLLDGEIAGDRYSHYRLDGGSPRELVRLDGVSAPYSPSSLAVSGEQVSRIRIGYHQKPGGNELHVVLDLASPDVGLTELEAAASRIRLVVGPSGAPP